MKKYLLLGTSLIVASSAYAITCEQLPECSSLGFTQTATDCAGKNMLKCPFDTDKVFCGGESSGGSTEQGCDAVGAILYSDLNCYEPLDKIASGVEPIAVVFDPINKFAIGLNNSPSPLPINNTKKDVTALTNCSTIEQALAENTNGRVNTSSIIAAGGVGVSSTTHAPWYCYNFDEEKPSFWFLPNIKELDTIYTHKDTINTSLTSIGGTPLTDGYYWSSTETDQNYGWKYSLGTGASSGSNDKGKTGYTRCAILYQQ